MLDGSPQSAPVWVGREGDRILICTGEASLKAKNTRRDPRVALSIVDFHNPYEETHLRGRVVERRPDNDFQYLDTISYKYIVKPFPFRSPDGTHGAQVAVPLCPSAAEGSAVPRHVP